MENSSIYIDDDYLPKNYIQNAAGVHNLAETLIMYKIGKYQ